MYNITNAIIGEYGAATEKKIILPNRISKSLYVTSTKSESSKAFSLYIVCVENEIVFLYLFFISFLKYQ